MSVISNQNALISRSSWFLTSTAPTACRHPVSGTVSLPSSGCFSPFPHGTGSLSVTEEYLGLEGGPPIFRQDCSCPALLEDDRSGFPYGAVTRYGPPFQTLPVPKPTAAGLVRFRSPLLAESRLMSVPPATEMFQFAGFASRAYEFSAGYPARVAPWGWVAPFGDPGINDRSHLPRAFRSVPRPSSPLSAKASTRCPSFALDPKSGPAPASPPVTTPAFRKTAAHRGKRQAGSLRSFETDRSAFGHPAAALA